MTMPLWQQIRDDLQGEIAAGRVTPGDKLPTEAALARRFGVNRHTVRRALAALQSEGVVHARRGAGVFVTNVPVPYRLGPQVRFSQNLAETGHTGARTILRLETVPAEAEEADALEIPKGTPVHLLENVAAIDGVPATHSTCYFPADRLPAFTEGLQGSGSITAALSACGIPDYRRDWTRIRAGRATGQIARHLHMAEGAPILRTISLNRTAEGWPVEYARTSFCADRVEFVVDGQSLDAPGAGPNA